MICQLTGMQVANASLYEGSSAAAEAVMMATPITGRQQIVVADSVHPDLLWTLRTYGHERDTAIQTVPATHGQVDIAQLAAAVHDQTAAVVVSSPNFYGCIERLDQIGEVARSRGALFVVSMDPIASGVLAPPGRFEADIVVGEGQPLGIPLQYGGPYLGFMAAREKYLRKMPGRIVGETKDRDGSRAFCLILQTREQHIRRERATSNVCTNQGLLAVRASIYMAAMGRKGFCEVASQCFDKAHYAASQICKVQGYSMRFDAPFFKEFVVKTTRGVKRVLSACRDKGILGGVPMARFDERLSDCFLVAVTEKRSKQEIDDFVATLSAA